MKRSRPHWFVIPGVTMLLLGFGLMFASSLGGRHSSVDAFPLPVGFTTAAVGGMLLTRTPLAVFFLLIFAISGLVLSIRECGLLHPLPALFAFLVGYCLPLVRRAKS